MALYTGQGTILGGLPVIATVSWGYDSWTREGYAEIEQIYWMKRDGTAGKPIPQHLRDRAEKYDNYFCCLVEQLNEQAAYEASKEDERDEMVLLTTDPIPAPITSQETP